MLWSLPGAGSLKSSWGPFQELNVAVKTTKSASPNSGCRPARTDTKATERLSVDGTHGYGGHCGLCLLRGSEIDVVQMCWRDGEMECGEQENWLRGHSSIRGGAMSPISLRNLISPIERYALIPKA